MSSRKVVIALCFTVGMAGMTTTAFSMAPFGHAIFYLNEVGTLVGEQVLTCKPDGWHAGNIHTAYYVETEVDCTIPTPRPPMSGPVPVCMPGSKGCTCLGDSPTEYTCTSLAAPPDAGPPNVPNWAPCSYDDPPPECMQLNGDAAPVDRVTHIDIGGAAVGGSGGGTGATPTVAASYVINYVLPASLTIQEACYEIEQCSMMPEPITGMGWTWLAGW